MLNRAILIIMAQATLSSNNTKPTLRKKGQNGAKKRGKDALHEQDI